VAHDYRSLPPDLPAPSDDGAADHLPGARMPDLVLESTQGPFELQRPGRLVLYIYPRTGVPGEPLIDGWNEIPGARGCTPQSCAFRDHEAELRELGAEVVGMSAQTLDEQREFAEREHIPYPLIGDPALALGEALRLPTFEAGGLTLYKRITLIVDDGEIVKVFYPVFPPDRNAGDVLAYLRS
jgi:peroxiredoxin